MIYNMICAVFSGSFDPPTYGHLNIIERSASLFNRVLVTIAVNKEKKYLFSPEERLEMINSIISPWQNVSAHVCDSLIVEFAQKNNAQVLLRGIRNTTDFAYEFDLSMMNKSINRSIETIFMPTAPEYFILKSSAIKEIASFGGDVSEMVPEIVRQALKRKFGGTVRDI